MVLRCREIATDDDESHFEYRWCSAAARDEKKNERGGEKTAEEERLAERESRETEERTRANGKR